jgi:hypothetical protein
MFKNKGLLIFSGGKSGDLMDFQGEECYVQP